MAKVETVRIAPSDPKSQGSYIEIRADDYDSKVHTLINEGAKSQAASKKKSAPLKKTTQAKGTAGSGNK